MIDTIIGIVIIVGVGYALYKMVSKKESVQDAVKDTLADAKTEATKLADVNKDGKVDSADVVYAAKEVTTVAKKAATKAKAAAKKVKAKK